MHFVSLPHHLYLSPSHVKINQTPPTKKPSYPSLLYTVLAEDFQTRRNGLFPILIGQTCMSFCATKETEPTRGRVSMARYSKTSIRVFVVGDFSGDYQLVIEVIQQVCVGVCR